MWQYGEYGACLARSEHGVQDMRLFKCSMALGLHSAKQSDQRRRLSRGPVLTFIASIVPPGFWGCRDHNHTNLPELTFVPIRLQSSFPVPDSSLVRLHGGWIYMVREQCPLICQQCDADRWFLLLRITPPTGGAFNESSD